MKYLLDDHEDYHNQNENNQKLWYEKDFGASKFDQNFPVEGK